LIITGPIARPSRPSVKFTAFAIATTASTPKTTYVHPGMSTECLENAANGNASRWRTASQSCGRCGSLERKR